MNKPLKKLAVLVGGEFREFEEACKSWTFLNDIEYDIFVSTWNISKEIMRNFNVICPPEHVDEARILKHFPNAIIKIQTQPDTNDANYKVYCHWQTLFDMAEESDFEYEYAVIIRPDFILMEKKSLSDFIKSIKDDCIYTLSPICVSSPRPIDIIQEEKIWFVQDVFFLGKYHFLKNVFKTLPPVRANLHHFVGKHFITNEWKIQDIYRGSIEIFEWGILRVSHRFFKNIDLNTKILIFRESHKFKTLDELKNDFLEKKIITEANLL